MVAHPEQLIRLDTGAFRAARTARAARGLAYWIVLAVAAAGVAVLIAVVPGAFGTHTEKLSTTATALEVPGAPAPADIPVTIWNATAIDGAANRLKIRLSGLGYPAQAAKSHHLPKGGLKGSWVFYTPGHALSAEAVAASLHWNANRSVRPLDGISPESIAPAVVLVVIGR